MNQNAVREGEAMTLRRVAEILRNEAECITFTAAFQNPVSRFHRKAHRDHDEMLALAEKLEGGVLVPREPTEAMLRAGLDARYQQSKRSQRVKQQYPGGYETWIKVGLIEDAPGMAREYKAMLAAADTEGGQ